MIIDKALLDKVSEQAKGSPHGRGQVPGMNRPNASEKIDSF